MWPTWLYLAKGIPELSSPVDCIWALVKARILNANFLFGTLKINIWNSGLDQDTNDYIGAKGKYAINHLSHRADWLVDWNQK